MLRAAAVAAGAPAGELFHQHVVAVDALVTDWHGQKWVDLPGHLRAVRRDGVLAFERADRHATAPKVLAMDATHVEDDLVDILFTEEQIQDRLEEMAQEIAADYEGKDLLLVGILRGAVMVMVDLARALPRHVEMDWIAISSYGSGTKSSGVVRLLKDLDTDITGRHVLIVDEIIDTGLTLSWLINNLGSRNAASVEICTLLRKPEALTMPVEREVHRLGHPQRVRRRLRPRLPAEVPQPARHRHPRAARLQLKSKHGARCPWHGLPPRVKSALAE